MRTLFPYGLSLGSDIYIHLNAQRGPSERPWILQKRHSLLLPRAGLREVPWSASTTRDPSSQCLSIRLLKRLMHLNPLSEHWGSASTRVSSVSINFPEFTKQEEAKHEGSTLVPAKHRGAGARTTAGLLGGLWVPCRALSMPVGGRLHPASDRSLAGRHSAHQRQEGNLKNDWGRGLGLPPAHADAEWTQQGLVGEVTRLHVQTRAELGTSQTSPTRCT